MLALAMLVRMYPPTARVSTVPKKSKVVDLHVGTKMTGKHIAKTLATVETIGDNMLGWILGAMAYDTLRNLNEKLADQQKRELERDREVRRIQRMNSKRIRKV
jgi:hypothetical protein